MTMPETTSSVKELVEIGVDSFKFLGSTLGKDYQMFATKYNFALKDYFDAKIKTLGKIKQAFFTSKVVNFHDIYVPQDLAFNNQNLTQDVFLDRVKENKRFVISATAGAGKSCMMRNLFLTILKESKPFFPIFYELRRVNTQQVSIIDSLVLDIAKYNNKFNKENLEYILKRDNTLLLLDGFDELNYDKKYSYISEINQLSELYPDLQIVISSRPEYGLFREWSLFNVIKIQTLNIKQSIQVIKNINYDYDISYKFISSLQKSLFETHNSFAINPLLLTIMLVTYEQCGEIPSKRHIFYKKAFEAIFNKHDVNKSGFLRKRLTRLDEEDFQKVFSMFCIGTYLQSKYIFSEDVLDKNLKKCLLNYNFQNTSVTSLKNELLVNIPLLMKDGQEYTFTHRSFQEYFTAIYIINNQDIKIKILKKVITKSNDNNVLKIAYDLNQKFFENRFFLPLINQFLEKCERKRHDTIKLLSVFFPKFSLTAFSSDYDISFIQGDIFLVTRALIELNYKATNLSMEALENFTKSEVKFQYSGEFYSVGDYAEFNLISDYHNYEELLAKLNGAVFLDDWIQLIFEIKKDLLKKNQISNDIFEELIC